MTPRFAGVCLLENPYPIDGVYDYRVPEELAGSIREGMFATVPFGTANRTRLALILELRDESAYTEVKQILSLCPEQLSLDAEMLGLCSFMKQRTLCTTGDAVRAMIPSSALSRLQEFYTVNMTSAPPDSDELPSSDLFVYGYLREHGERSAQALRARFGTGAELSLKRLRDRKYLLREVRLTEAGDGKTERVWELSVPPERAQTLAQGACDPGSRITSRKQRQVLSILLSSGEPMTTAEIIAAAEEKPETGLAVSPLIDPAAAKNAAEKMTDAPIKALAKKGLLLPRDRRVERNPYAEAKYIGQIPLSLNEEQSAAADTLSALAFSGEPKAALLYGVTGSGKTCVMTALIDRLLEHGKGVILLLPEIALTPQSVAVFCARYGSRVAVIHSALSAGERYDAYRKIREGDADVVIGTRSAVFSPVRNLGAIIIDEEQEHTYKSDQSPRYHTRDIARFRCAYRKALMVLASATPSLESYRKAKEGVYSLIRLTHRYGAAQLPRVEIADMRREPQSGNLSPLGERLVRELSRVTAAGEQSVLFLNRRGYNHFVSCRSCGQAVLCPGCSVAMTYHTRRGTYQEGTLVCHWCGRRMPLPSVCPSCGSEHLARMGFGTQRVEEELGKLLPSANILRMDTDTTSTKFAYDRMLGTFRRHEADILLGTQMVTKGHDFPDVTLVGVLLADASLYLDDYRASERTFAMLTQVIGRAGRSDKPGMAIIQTNNPDSEIIRLACAQDYDTFYEREIRLRKLLVFPPFCDIALLTVTGTEESELLRASNLLAKELRELTEGDYHDVELVVFGPFESPVYRVDNRYRMRMVVKCVLNRRSYAMFSELFCRFSKVGRHITLSIDFNPTNL